MLAQQLRLRRLHRRKLRDVPLQRRRRRQLPWRPLLRRRRRMHCHQSCMRQAQQAMRSSSPISSPKSRTTLP